MVWRASMVCAWLVVGCGDDSGTPVDGGAGGRDAGATGVDAGAGVDGSSARDGSPEHDDAGPTGPRYDEVVFRATHNSYSGGERGSIVQQLDRGVRFLELDVHDNDYATRGYTVGHDAPGHEVAAGGENPDGVGLDAWLRTIADWSAARPTHAPITVALDLKDDLTDNRSYAEGNLAALNALLVTTFGARLVRPDEVADGFPPVDAMRGRVLAVLSGDEGSRIAYVRDPGNAPAVAVNARGRVLEVHDSGTGTLWYWTGELLPEGRVRWHRHGRYDTGRAPAVAMNDDGDIVEVHQSETATTLWYHVARMREDFEVEWGPSVMYDDGVTPTIRFEAGSATRLREIHASESTGDHWFWDATLDPTARTLALGAHDRTSDPLHAKDEDGTGAGRVRVFTGTDGAAPSNTLQYEAAGGVARIRYAEIAFVEMQNRNDRDLMGRFYAAPSGAHALARGWRASGGIVRLWGFDEGDTTLDPPVTFPATDTPDAAWYADWTESVGAYER